MLRRGLLLSRRSALAGAKLAAAAATTTVAVAVCESTSQTQTSLVPKFELGGNRYDQSAFQGRLQYIQELIDVRTAFTTDEQLASAQKKLSAFKDAGCLPAGLSDLDMWEAQRTVDAVIHGPTGEKMFLPGRMSMFVPMNVPATAGMIMARSVPATLFWQWMNQTYNVVNNYVCRAGPEVEYGPLAQSYALAVTASCSIAVGAGKLLKAFPKLQAFGLFVPYLAVISAGTCNVAFTRMDEIRNGINVADSNGNVVGRSVIAGQARSACCSDAAARTQYAYTLPLHHPTGYSMHTKLFSLHIAQTAVFKTVTTRSMFIPLFSLVGPPLVMKAVFATGAVAAGTTGAFVLEISAVAAFLAIALPCALAIQPLQMELDVASLEPEFQSKRNADGTPLKYVYASKGL